MTNDSNDPDGIPSPPHPLQREEPLPSQSVKSSMDDPVARQRVEHLLASATYRRADLDVGFLDKDDVRGARLQLDYLKPELHLRARGIEHTIVVFGGTRIPEPGAARRKVQAQRRALEESPDDPDLRSASKSPRGYWRRARTTMSPGNWVKLLAVPGAVAAIAGSR